MQRLRTVFMLAFLILAGSAGAQQEVPPRDVYPLILEIVRDINELRQYKNIQTPIEHVPLKEDKSPTDVYEKTYVLLTKVAALARKNGYATERPVVLPEKLPGRKVPADVLVLLNQIHAELQAIMKAVGMSHEARSLETQPGIMPSEVYRQVCKAIALVDTL